VSLARAQEEPTAIGQEPEIAGIVQRVGQPPAEVVAERVHELAKGGRRKPAPPQPGQGDKLENVDRCVSALGESPGNRPPRRDRRQKNPTGIPTLQLARREASKARDLPRAVARLEPHACFPVGKSPATPFVAMAPSTSFRVTPPASCVDQVTVTRL